MPSGLYFIGAFLLLLLYAPNGSSPWILLGGNFEIISKNLFLVFMVFLVVKVLVCVWMKVFG